MVRPVAPLPLAIRTAVLRRAWVVFLVLAPALPFLEPLAADQANLAGPAGSGAFGTSVTVLPNGNFVVTDPFYDLPTGEYEAGAVYLYSPSGALVSTLTGTNSQDQVGSGGIFIVGSGNFVVCSPRWASGYLQQAGAVTWGSGVTGISGTVSAYNSLVGGSAMDKVGSPPPQGSAITVLTNGNYVASDPAWGGSSALGAVTWGNGATGTSGVVSSANSLVGASNDDQIGKYGVEVLKKGNYAVRSPEWDNGPITNAGAVTWGNGTTGTSGVVGPGISLVGSSRSDQVGSVGTVSTQPCVTTLANGNYVVLSPYWDNGAIADAGAVTWVNGATGLAGPITSSNSLVGSSSLDFRDWASIRELSNGHYVVCFPSWNYGAIDNAGAVMWCNGNGGPTGPITPTVALVGTVISGDVGYGGITPLTNGNYVVCSPDYTLNGLTKAGAVTWCNGAPGASGRTGPVTEANSLIGARDYDQVGSNGATALSNGNYVVISSLSSSGNVTSAGAVTWCNGKSTRTGVISTTNSLMGSQPYDEVGAGGVTALSNGNYVVASPEWNNGSTATAGAVTWGSGTSGVSGPVSAANSLVGTSPDDRVGSDRVLALGNGNYVVSSTGWNKDGSNTGAGAVTWSSGTKGVKGPVTSLNSLVGSTANDHLGHAGIQVLSNRNYLICSDTWSNGSASNAGAITLGSGSSGISGVVTGINSLIGSSADSRVGSGSAVYAADGGYAFSCPGWNNGGLPHTGAVVLVLPGGIPTGAITSSLGFVGRQANGGTDLSFGYDPVRHRIVVGQPDLNQVSLFSYSSSLTPREKFAWWASAAGLQGAAAAPSSTPFGDGVSNLLKYAFNLNGSTADQHPLPPGSGTSGLPPFTISGSSPACVFRTEYVRRKDSGLAYQPMVSDDLQSFSTMTGTETVSPIDDTWERVVMEQPVDPAATSQLFGVVQVSLP